MELREILKLKDLKPVELVTLIRLSEMAHKKPSHNELSQSVGVSKPTIHRTINNLVDMGLVSKSMAFGAKNEYQIKGASKPVTEIKPEPIKPKVITPKPPQPKKEKPSTENHFFPCLDEAADQPKPKPKTKYQYQVEPEEMAPERSGQGFIKPSHTKKRHVRKKRVKPKKKK